VLEIEEHAGRDARIALVHQHRTPAQEIAVTLQREVDGRVEQRVAGADEGGQRLPLRRHEPLLEGDPFIAWQHRLTDADEAVAVPDRSRHVRHLVPAWLALLHGAAEAPERLEEEGLDVVRLEPPGLGALHLLANAVHAARVHGVVGEGVLLDQILDVRAVEGVVHHLREARAHLGLLSVADRLDQQLAERPAFELYLPEDVEHLAAERLPRLLELLQQGAVDVPLAGLLGHQVPQVADLGLADPMDAPEALLDAVRVPW
jgi:hypothetical protein